MSFQQERLYFLEQLYPGTATYNVPVTFRLRGRLDIGALSESLRAVRRRHRVLDAKFGVVAGRPVQLDGGGRALELRVIDLASQLGAQREREALRLALEEARRPFPMGEGPFARATLVRIGVDDHLLTLVLHHIVFDGWSLDIMIREISALYRATLAGTTSGLESPAMQYADFAVWQRDPARNGLAAQLGDALERLQGAPMILDLPGDRSRPAVQTFRGGIRRFQVSVRAVKRLSEVGRASRATPFMTMAAVFAALLHRQTGVEEVLIGVPTAGRSRTEHEGVIGLFANTLVLRADVGGAPTFRRLLERMRSDAMKALAAQEVPYEQVVDALQPWRDLSRSPVVQVALQYRAELGTALELDGLVVESVPVTTGTAKFDLSLSIDPSREGMAAWFEYSADLFDPATIDGLAVQLKTLLADAAVAPDRPVRRLALAPSRAVAAPAAQPHRPGACAHQLFELTAERSPGSVAASFASERLTYMVLERAANRVARRLHQRGVGRGDLVGLLTMPSLETVIGILGIHKSGAAYLPLDPTHPVDRLRWIVEDSEAALLLAQPGLRVPLALEGAELVPIEWRDGPLHADASRPAPTATADDLAYVIYTSGSTGRPKGVEVTHGALVDLLESMARELGIGPDDVLLSVTTPSFDISVLELLLPLVTGASVAIAPQDARADGDELLRLFREHRATVLQATPTTWRLLLRAGWRGERGICGGEALTPEIASRLAAAATAAWNVYGPTEATIWSTACRLGTASAGPLTIGTAIAGWRVHVLDDDLAPLPPGPIGELYIGGVGVARGYRGRPALTGERFLPDPSGEPGARRYRTGDLGRLRSDGRIEFLGRRDRQVKVRGHRVEPGEVEAALEAHPVVRQAAVVVGHDGELQAFLVTAGKGEPDRDDLRAFLLARLPVYMVPSALSAVEALPLTPNGKVDRAALRRTMGRVLARRRAAFEAPQSQEERLLAQAWEEVLHGVRVSRSDSFFGIGGNSLLVLRAVDAARQVGLEVTPRQFFEHATLADLAAALRSAHD